MLEKEGFYPQCNVCNEKQQWIKKRGKKAQCSNGSIFVHFWELRRSPEVGVSLFLQ